MNRQGIETRSTARPDGRPDGWMVRLGEWRRWRKSQRRLSHLPEHLRRDIGFYHAEVRPRAALGNGADFQRRAV